MTLPARLWRRAAAHRRRSRWASGFCAWATPIEEGKMGFLVVVAAQRAQRQCPFRIVRLSFQNWRKPAGDLVPSDLQRGRRVMFRKSWLWLGATLVAAGALAEFGATAGAAIHSPRRAPRRRALRDGWESKGRGVA